MAKYKLVKVKDHIYGGGLNYAPYNEAWFLLECGHLQAVFFPNWKSKKRRCYECAGNYRPPPSPMVLNVLDNFVRSSANNLSWSDIDEQYHPMKVTPKEYKENPKIAEFRERMKQQTN